MYILFYGGIKNMAEKTPVNAWIDKTLYSDCKIEAIKRDVTLAEFVTNALEFYIKKSNQTTEKNDIELN